MREEDLYRRYLKPWLLSYNPDIQITVIDFHRLPDLVIYNPGGSKGPLPCLFFVEMKIGRFRPCEDAGGILIPWRTGQWGWIQSRPHTTSLCVWFEHPEGTAECRFYYNAVKEPKISDSKENFVNILPILEKKGISVLQHPHKG